MTEKVGKLQRSKTLTQPKTAAVINDKTVENEQNNIHGYGCSAVINDKTVENEGNNFHGYGCSAVINDKTVENELKTNFYFTQNTPQKGQKSVPAPLLL